MGRRRGEGAGGREGARARRGEAPRGGRRADGRLGPRSIIVASPALLLSPPHLSEAREKRGRRERRKRARTCI
eukprot:8109-Pelagococcus_subviridis.AAC.5